MNTGFRQIVIFLKVKRCEVTIQDDDAVTTPMQYGVTIDHDRLHVLEASYRDPIVDRNPETDAMTHVTEWNKPRDNPAL